MSNFNKTIFKFKNISQPANFGGVFVTSLLSKIIYLHLRPFWPF